MTVKDAHRPIWVAEGQEKRTAVRAMFADIAPRYDLLNSLLSLRLHHRWRSLAVSLLKLRPGDSAADICSGTGDFLIPLRRAVGPNGRLIAVDFCEPMLELSRGKFGEGVVLGDGCSLPIASGVFDAATVGWGIRNVPDVDAAHSEIARILRKGGRFVSIDMAQPRNTAVASVSRAAFRTFAPLLGRLFGKSEAYRYLPESTQRFMSRDELSASMRRAGFEEVHTRDLFFGNICIHSGVRS